jgi:S-methylmethionine-dependent homocysteine/selenocysteine methylase
MFPSALRDFGQQLAIKKCEPKIPKRLKNEFHDFEEQGCQIFLATTYQNGEKNIPRREKIYQIM